MFLEGWAVILKSVEAKELGAKIRSVSPNKKGVTWCCEVLADRVISRQVSRNQTSRKLIVNQAHGSGMSSMSHLGVAVVPIHAYYVRLYWCRFVAFVFSCQYLMPNESAVCLVHSWVAGWVELLLTARERQSAFDLFICACLCLQELDGFLLCLHTVLTFCKCHGHVVIHSYTPCFHSRLLYCILTANSFICIPPPYSFTSFSKRLHGDDVRNPFWPSFPFSLPPPSFHAFVCSHS